MQWMANALKIVFVWSGDDLNICLVGQSSEGLRGQWELMVSQCNEAIIAIIAWTQRYCLSVIGSHVNDMLWGLATDWSHWSHHWHTQPYSEATDCIGLDLHWMPAIDCLPIRQYYALNTQIKANQTYRSNSDPMTRPDEHSLAEHSIHWHYSHTGHQNTDCGQQFNDI